MWRVEDIQRCDTAKKGGDLGRAIIENLGCLSGMTT